LLKILNIKITVRIIIKLYRISKSKLRLKKITKIFNDPIINKLYTNTSEFNPSKKFIPFIKIKKHNEVKIREKILLDKKKSKKLIFVNDIFIFPITINKTTKIT